MNGEDLDARLRRHFAGVDTAPGFEARVAARVAALRPLPAAELRLRYERRQFEVEARLRREAWTWGATAVAAGLAAIALVWRNAPTVVAWVHGGFESVEQGGNATLAVLALGTALLWPVVQRFSTPEP